MAEATIDTLSYSRATNTVVHTYTWSCISATLNAPSSNMSWALIWADLIWAGPASKLQEQQRMYPFLKVGQLVGTRQ